MTQAGARDCGGCTACCIAYDIPPVNKKENVPCRHLRAGGCGIHWRRPSLCRAFRCLWLQGFGEEEERPDRSQRILTKYGDRSGHFGVLQVACLGDYRPPEEEVALLTARFMEAYRVSAAQVSVTCADGTSYVVGNQKG